MCFCAPHAQINMHTGMGDRRFNSLPLSLMGAIAIADDTTASRGATLLTPSELDTSWDGVYTCKATGEVAARVVCHVTPQLDISMRQSLTGGVTVISGAPASELDQLVSSGNGADWFGSKSREEIERLLADAKARLETEFVTQQLYDYESSDPNDKTPIWWVVNAIKIRRPRGGQQKPYLYAAVSECSTADGAKGKVDDLDIGYARTCKGAAQTLIRNGTQPPPMPTGGAVARDDRCAARTAEFSVITMPTTSLPPCVNRRFRC